MGARKKARIAGILYIIGTISGILSVILTGSADTSPEYVGQIAALGDRYILGSFFVLIMGFSLALIPIVLYPVLRKHNETLAVGYLTFRGALEAGCYIAIFISLLMMLHVGQQPDSDMAALMLKLRELSTLSTLFVFSIGALMFYTVLYQSNLVPGWLPVWGIIAIIFHLTAGFLKMFAVVAEPSWIINGLNFPIFVQEMVLAVWLIARGFRIAR